MRKTKLLQLIGYPTPIVMDYPDGSHIVECFGYDAVRAELYVKIIDHAMYRYRNVPPSIGQGMIAAASVGKFFLKEVRDFYNYERLTSGVYRLVDSAKAEPAKPKANPRPLPAICTYPINRPDCWL